MITNKRLRSLLKIAIIILLGFNLFHTCMWRINIENVPSVSRGQFVKFEQKMNMSATIVDVDSTDDYIFFAYDAIGVVEVYSREGVYQYSLAFYNDTNGVLEMRCDDNLLYICDFAGYELVFDGQTLIDSIDPANRNHQMAWYNESSGNVFCQYGKLFDKSGNYIMDIPGRTR